MVFSNGVCPNSIFSPGFYQLGVPKVSQAALRYVDVSPFPVMMYPFCVNCSRCASFLENFNFPDGRLSKCRIVQGDIKPSGYCFGFFPVLAQSVQQPAYKTLEALLGMPTVTACQGINWRYDNNPQQE